MIVKIAMKFPFKSIKISRVVLLSGILTFMYCIEFCIGIRTVYYTFKLWSDPANLSHEKPVSWTLCVACLMTATVTAFSVNVISAMWEQKELEEREKEKSALRFAFHIVVGGMIWRYVCLWFSESKELQKKGALLLTMTKFFFTQTFTIPMVIVHVSVIDNVEELIFDVCSVICISINLVFTCMMFAWCSNEVDELKKWDFETINLVPLIFQTSLTAAPDIKDNKITTGREVVSKPGKKEEGSNDYEYSFVRLIVFFQSFGFSLGRILALGILLKLAGIYAVSIMFLQLLISVIYLKFQFPILVSESLPKWRQLSRLAFMSYILIFEWHLNRDPKTAYDFSFNMKHSISYYCLATVESVFYIVTWTITTSFSTKSESSFVRKQQSKFSRIILIIGSSALIISLTLHILLLFWRSRKISVFVYSVRRRYENTKIRLSSYGCGGKGKDERTENASPKRSHVDISSPISTKKNGVEFSQEENRLEKHNSYRDLREPLDDEIEIYFRKCDNPSKSNDADEKSSVVNAKTTPVEENRQLSRRNNGKAEDNLNDRANDFPDNVSSTSEAMQRAATIEPTSSDEKFDNETAESAASENSPKSKFSLLSENVSEKVSSASVKFAGTMRDLFKRSKGQLQNLRRSPSSDSKKSDTPTKTKTSSPEKRPNNISQTSTESIEVTEDYFVGDDRCYEIDSLPDDEQPVRSKRIKFTDQTVSQLKTFGTEIDDEISAPTDTSHKDGDAPCPCYICKTLGDGRFRRRRSSSVPPSDRKTNQIKEEDDTNDTNDESLSRYMSTPNISESCSVRIYRDQKIPPRFNKKALNLSVLSLNNKVEHYV